MPWKPAKVRYHEPTMLRVSGPKRSFLWGWLCASSLLLFLIIAGCVISPRRLPGDIVPGTTPTPTPNPSATPTPTPGATPQGKLYVSNGGANSILRFDQGLTASGNTPPAATISGTNTQLNAPAYIFLDAAADRLYVANNGDLSILIFDSISTKTGNVAPERVIVGANTTLVTPTDVSVDKIKNLLYVADDIDIHVFASASTATGNIAPARSYSTGFAVSAIFIDGANDRLYAADQAGQAISVYDNASTLAAGPITANRTIQGANTHLGAPAGIQLDGAGRLVVSNATAKSITIYNNAATATGNIAPSAEIVGSNTGFSVPDQIVVNPAGTGSVYNADPGAARVAVYGSLSTATGNIAPTRSISGPSTTLTTGGQPVGVALDTTR
jgi:phage baseplate assembly protein gpV